VNRRDYPISNIFCRPRRSRVFDNKEFDLVQERGRAERDPFFTNGNTDQELRRLSCCRAERGEPLGRRYPVETLAESPGEGIFSGHPQMPEFVFDGEDVGAITTYLKVTQE
jgi:hypothetical protein